MNLCGAHIEELAMAMKARGLSDHVSATPKEAIARTKAGGFDPYFRGYLLICNTCAFIHGDPGHSVCAACTVINSCDCGKEQCASRLVVNHAADQALEEFMRHNEQQEN